jgi:hypothetical protein
MTSRSDSTDQDGTVYYVSAFFADSQVTADHQAAANRQVTTKPRTAGRLPPIEVVQARIAYRMRYLRGVELLDNHRESSDRNACTCGRPSPCALAAEGRTLAMIYENWAPQLEEHQAGEPANAEPSTPPPPNWARVRPYVLPRQRQGSRHYDDGATDDA